MGQAATSTKAPARARTRWRWRPAAIGLALLLVGAAVACGSGGSDASGPDVSAVSGGATTSTTAASSEAGGVPEEPQNALGHTIDIAVVDAAEAARWSPTGAEEAGQRLRVGVTGDELWAATYVYSSTGDDAALLEPLVTNPDASIRVLAAGGLLRLGQVSGFEPLVDEVGNAEVLSGSEPPQSIGEVAGVMLTMASGEEIDITPNEASQKAWSEWYAAHEPQLRYDDEHGWRAS